jgi:hypothetical protein
MGYNSYAGDVEDRHHDDRMMGRAFGIGAGAAGLSREYREAKRSAAELVRRKLDEAQAKEVERRTRRMVDDSLAWIEATVGVVPLRRKP